MSNAYGFNNVLKETSTKGKQILTIDSLIAAVVGHDDKNGFDHGWKLRLTYRNQAGLSRGLSSIPVGEEQPSS